MKNTNPLSIARLNLLLSWLSIFTESWLLLIRRLPIDSVSVFFFCFFLVIAVGSWMGTVVEEKKSKGEIK